MKTFWILVAVLALVLGVAGYTLAQSTGPQGGMMGQGMGMMTGQPLTQEQLEQFAKQHGITVEQAKQMTDTCTQVMSNTKEGQPQAQ